MPLVTPNTGETKEKFMNRCMGNSGMNNEFPDQSQRYAVSRSIWEDKNFWTMPATIETYAKSKNVYATDAPFNCECIDCGHKMVSETAHCNELKCSECGGQMRRQNRPGVGQNALWQNNAPWNLVDPKFLELHDFSPKAMAFTDEPLTKGLTTFDPTIPLLRKRVNFKSKIVRMERHADKIFFNGVAMTPGTFNQTPFTKGPLRASIPFWQNIPLVINHEDEKDPHTAIIGYNMRGWWQTQKEELWFQAYVDDRDMLKVMNKDFLPAVSPALMLYFNERGEVVEIMPTHLALLISYDPANPVAGVRELEN